MHRRKYPRKYPRKLSGQSFRINLALISRALTLGVALSLSGCLEVEREEPGGATGGDRSAATNSTAPATALRLILQDQSTAPPARVSVAFKLETDTGVPVPNLPAESFVLRENGSLISAKESVKRITPEDGDFVFSTLLLLDLSGSVIDQSLEALLEAAANFIREVLPPAIEERTSKILAVGVFDGRAEIEIITDYSSNPDHLVEQVFLIDESTMQDSSTNLYGAAISGLNSVTNQVEATRRDNPEIFGAGALVLFTDGTDQAAIEPEEAAFNAVDERAEDIAVMTIGLGAEVNSEVLQRLGPNGFRAASEQGDLITSFGEIAQFVSDEADSFYKLDYCSPKRTGPQLEHTLTIEVHQVTDENQELSGELDVIFSAESFGAGCEL